MSSSILAAGVCNCEPRLVSCFNTNNFGPNLNSSIQYLLDEARDGDKSAINMLMDCKRNYLRHVVQSRLDRKIRRRIDVSDVVQEILFFASRRLQKYLDKPDLPFEHWLKGIAKDRVVEAYRQHKHAQRRSVSREQTTNQGEHSQSQLINQLPETNLTPATFAIKREVTQSVERALFSLNPCDRDVVVMRHFQYLTNQEIAAKLNVSNAAASVRYVRALKRLRDCLKTQEQNNDEGW